MKLFWSIFSWPTFGICHCSKHHRSCLDSQLPWEFLSWISQFSSHPSFSLTGVFSSIMPKILVFFFLWFYLEILSFSLQIPPIFWWLMTVRFISWNLELYFCNRQKEIHKSKTEFTHLKCQAVVATFSSNSTLFLVMASLFSISPCLGKLIHPLRWISHLISAWKCSWP